MNFWRKWHRWLGTIAAVLLVLIGGTGVLLQIDEVGHVSERASARASVPLPPLDAVALAARVEALSGGRRIEMLRLEAHSKAPSAVVRFAGDKKVVEIDLATGKQKPGRETPKSAGGTLAKIRLLVLMLHTFGIAGTAGHVAGGLVGVVLVGLSGSGLWVWWTMRRERVRRNAAGTWFWK